MSSFNSALSGLQANQAWIDIIGNNLANTNTYSFKSSRALFADLLNRTMRPATPPTGSIGGTNPQQVGLGVRLAMSDRRLTQGALDPTGRTFDLALAGQGYFAATDGVQTLYTRLGSFGLDGAGNMVDIRTGLRILDANGQTFSIDTSQVLPPSATGMVDFQGNLPAEVTGPLQEVLSSGSAYASGTSADMTGAASEPFNIPAGETWTMELVVNGGAPQLVSIAGSGSITAQDVVNEITAQTEDVVASVGGSGEVILTSERSGASSTIKVTQGEVGKDLKGLLGLGDFVQGTEATATTGTDLNDLTTNLTDYVSGDLIEIAGTDADGTPVVGSFTYGVDGTTVGDLTSFVDALYGQSTATFNGTTGLIDVTADASGEAELSLSISDGLNQTGRSDWARNYFSVSTDGTGPDTVTTSSEVFDTEGTSHVVTFDYVRQDDGTWTMNTSVPPTEGTVTNGTVTGITFNENGSILTPTTAAVEIQFGTLSSQTMTLDYGVSGSFEGLTQFGSPASVVVDSQDGFGAGELVNMNVDEEGVIEGFFTNGQTLDLGSFGVATFANASGLEETAANYLASTANTGQRILGSGTASGAGAVIGGALEASNVDVAQEFVHLIEAQRGFQANARVITVQDELLAEAVNVV